MSVNSSPQITEAQELRSIFRAQFLSLFWLLLLCIVLGRVVYIQIFKHTYYTDLADKQYIAKTPSSFDRGSIFFKNQNGDVVSAAKLSSVYRIAIDPTRLENKEEVFTTLSQYVPLSQETFFAKANKRDDPYEEIAVNVSEDKATPLEKKKIKGVMFVKDNKRSYPQATVGSQVLGFVGSDGRNVRGQYGIEKYYDDVLTRNSDEKTINFFAELFADIDTNLVSNTDARVGDVVLTIDSEVERLLHKTLVETKAEWRSEMIGGIVMDPKTGAIIAMESLPSFDPNDFSNVENQNVYRNPLVSSVYEMGSIIKPLTMASALDSGVVSEETTYYDTGFRDLNNYKVRNYDEKARGTTKMQTILDKSLNVGIVFLVEQLGIKRFQDYFNKFGIGEETGIDLPNEAGGLTKNLKSNVLVDSATAGFGQGIAITPIQTIRALSALGNGGYLPAPHVVERINYKNGTVKPIIPDQGEMILQKGTSERVTRMLVHVVDTALKDGAYKMPHYSVAAKTGTAQMAKPGGGYYEDRYLHSFFGYFPAYEPRYIVFLFHTYPKGAEYASATLTEPFYKIVKFLISYYQVPPDR
jgi:cell division protein FtsI/penicillin-binding protein 2